MSNKGKIKFFVKAKNFNSLYLSILFIITFILIVFTKSDYIIVNKIKSLSTDRILPLTKIITSPIQIMTNIANTLNEYRFLKNQNLKLKEEVVRLKKWQTLALKNERENKAYKQLLNSTTNNINVVKTAAVISQSPEFYTNTITINAGKIHGVTEGLIVINARGLVGKIISSTNTNSKVILINNQSLSVPVRTNLSNSYAIIEGSSNGKNLKSSFVKDKNDIKLGDFLVTSGSAKIFPKDILVGKVVKINENEFIAVPFVDFKNLDYVQIVDR